MRAAPDRCHRGERPGQAGQQQPGYVPDVVATAGHGDQPGVGGHRVQLARPAVSSPGQDVARGSARVRDVGQLEAEPAGRRDGTLTLRLAGVGIEVPLGGVETPGRHVALRAENVHLGHSAHDQPCRLSATLVEATFRGTVLDYRLALTDGQTLVATTTRHLEMAPGSAVAVGFSPDAVIVLED